MTKPEATPGNFRGRLFIIVIALLTFGPFTLAWYMAKHPEWLGKTSNYGELITPPLPTQFSDFQADPASADASLAELKGHWVLVQMASQAQCAAACLEGLHRSKQVWLRLSKDLPRVRRLLLTSDNALDAVTREALRRDDDSTLLVAKAAPALQQLLIAQAASTGADATLWLLDPQGNLMMRYPLNYDPHGLLRDLQHLLRISQAG